MGAGFACDERGASSSHDFAISDFSGEIVFYLSVSVFALRNRGREFFLDGLATNAAQVATMVPRFLSAFSGGRAVIG